MGLQDLTLSKKLQLDPTLMLETAITAARKSKEAAAGYKGLMKCHQILTQ